MMKFKKINIAIDPNRIISDIRDSFSEINVILDKEAILFANKDNKFYNFCLSYSHLKVESSEGYTNKDVIIEIIEDELNKRKLNG